MARKNVARDSQDNTPEEFFAQIEPDEAPHLRARIAIFGTKGINSGVYRAHIHRIKGGEILYLATREFSGRGTRENYSRFQEFVEQVTRAKAFMYDPERDSLHPKELQTIAEMYAASD
jgi:hypothetical protein